MFAVGSIRRRLVRAYQVACARDDVAGHGLIVPSGVWVCERCQHALLELAALREHFRTEHATP
jgi:hypothetical protein